ncbi:MAG: efflux transporter outer membrane subunit [Syntrophobacteraceae bacterium]
MGGFSSYRFPLLALAAACLALSGCMVGPNYFKPKVPAPQQWVGAAGKGVSADVPADVTHWWTLFKDPMLDALVDQAVKANKDLKIAAARIREARAQRTVAAAGLFPTLDATALYTHSRASDNASTSPLPPGLFPDTGGETGVFTEGQDLFQAGFDANWEIDIFGRVRRSVEAATADVSASEESYRDTLITLLSEVAVNYMTVRGSQLRLDIALRNIAAQEQTLELTRARFEAGLSSELDVAQASAQHAATESQVPSFETSMRQAMYRLATLLGSSPGEMVEKLSKVEPVPGIPPAVPVGLPSDLLRRRPDVRQAERQLAAATARIGVATADLFPRLSLTGSLGQSAINLSDIALGSSTFWSIGPTLRWNIFNAGSTRATIEAQKARTEQALGTYEKIVLTSLQDVESALVAYSKEQTRRDALAAAVRSNERAYEISSELYAKGLVDFLRVLESQRSLYVTQDQFALSDQNVSSNLVALYKALGGGWEVQ